MTWSARAAKAHASTWRKGSPPFSAACETDPARPAAPRRPAPLAGDPGTRPSGTPAPGPPAGRRSPRSSGKCPRRTDSRPARGHLCVAALCDGVHRGERSGRRERSERKERTYTPVRSGSRWCGTVGADPAG
ncbi:hypothetical protein GCM10009863_37220 [Streptomyces axinellae]|uniref:Uncharacterized protein n=1 Tax=Streptomyces axinellae TaxID=552788 RepID=A0ABN3Q8L8_9ACTN